MQNAGLPGRVRIIRTPQGEAPLSIRKAWVGLVLPCYRIMGFSNGKEYGVLSQQPVRKQYGVSVPQDAALEALEKENPQAAAWWKEHGFPRPGECFGFSDHEVEIIGGVTRQRLIQVMDEMQGDPYR